MFCISSLQHVQSAEASQSHFQVSLIAIKLNVCLFSIVQLLNWYVIGNNIFCMIASWITWIICVYRYVEMWCDEMFIKNWNFILQGLGTLAKKKERRKILSHHLFFCMRDFSYHLGEDTEVFFSLYDSQKGKFIRYVVGCLHCALVIVTIKKYFTGICLAMLKILHSLYFYEMYEMWIICTVQHSGLNSDEFDFFFFQWKISSQII